MLFHLVPTDVHRMSRVFGVADPDEARHVLIDHGAHRGVRVVARYEPETDFPIYVSDTVIVDEDGVGCDLVGHTNSAVEEDEIDYSILEESGPSERDLAV